MIQEARETPQTLLPLISGKPEMSFMMRKSATPDATCSPPPCGEEVEVGV